MLSFSIETFLEILKNYNQAIWPMQIVAYILIAVILILAFKPNRYSSRIILGIFSFYWLFTGVVFCLLYWAPFHRSGYIFGICCILQGLLFLYCLVRSSLVISTRDKTYTAIGILYVFYAVIGYAIIGYSLDHVYPKFFPPGLVPCPTTIFTFGIFLIIYKRVPIIYLVIPFIISVAGIMAAYKGIYEDIGLFVAGVLGTYLLLWRNSLNSRE